MPLPVVSWEGSEDLRIRSPTMLENLLLDENGDLKISDFGLSALYEGGAEEGGSRANVSFHSRCLSLAWAFMEVNILRVPSISCFTRRAERQTMWRQRFWLTRAMTEERQMFGQWVSSSTFSLPDSCLLTR